MRSCLGYGLSITDFKSTPNLIIFRVYVPIHFIWNVTPVVLVELLICNSYSNSSIQSAEYRFTFYQIIYRNVGCTCICGFNYLNPDLVCTNHWPLTFSNNTARFFILCSWKTISYSCVFDQLFTENEKFWIH